MKEVYLSQLGERANEQGQETVSMPVVSFETERGSQLVSALLRASDATIDSDDQSMVAAVDEILTGGENYKTAQAEFQNIRTKYSLDEETTYQMALTYDKPERLPYVLDMVVRHKPDVKDAPEAARLLVALLQKFDKMFSTTAVSQQLDQKAQEDREQREAVRQILEGKLRQHIDFFQPAATTTAIRRVNYVPTDLLRPKQSGYSAMLGDEQVIVSHRENAGNQEHEFLHGIINPITRKLAEQLTEEAKARIVELSSPALRPDYGDDWESLLNEELIRAYNDEFQHDVVKIKQDFVDQINRLDEATFQVLQSDPQRQKIFASLHIARLDDLKAKAEELYELQQQAQHQGWRGKILDMYREYAARANREINFEIFLNQKIQTLIHE